MRESSYPGFLESEISPASYDKAGIHVIPVEMEKSVSYGRGTANGPKAILEASQQLEAFNGIADPDEITIYTHGPVRCTAETPHEDVGAIRSVVSGVVGRGAVPFILGGEHTVTLGGLQALKDEGLDFGVVQFDAHADLRDTYEDSPLSHACIMRRAYDMGLPIMQIGIRSLSLPEEIFRQEKGIPSLSAEKICREGIPAVLLPQDFPETIYITFDLDCFDPCIMPATGTPEPGGLDWYQVVDLLVKAAEGRRICGADVVELAPVENLLGPDFTAAKLVYTMMGIISRANMSL